MWGRLAKDSEAKEVVRYLPVYESDLTALLRTNLWRRIFRPASVILLPVRRGPSFETPARSARTWLAPRALAHGLHEASARRSYRPKLVTAGIGKAAYRGGA